MILPLLAASASGASAAPPATAISTGSSFYESPHKMFSPVEIDGHSTLVSSLEKSSMKVKNFSILSFLHISPFRLSSFSHPVACLS
jgi:hypothetical protein